MEPRPVPRRNSLALGLVLLGALFLAVPMALAATGGISSTAKYAWGNDTGWVNFAPSNSTVTVTDTGLTGYAWSQNDGWLNLAPAHSGVTNNGQGTLGGFAWDESRGWVSFTGVTISASGKFQGEATGANGYAINFSCSNCDVVTTWRPASTNTSASPGAISPVYAAPQQTQTQAQAPQPSGPPPAIGQKPATSPPSSMVPSSGSSATSPPGVGTSISKVPGTTTPHSPPPARSLSPATSSPSGHPPATTTSSATPFVPHAVAIFGGIGLILVILFFAVRLFV